MNVLLLRWDTKPQAHQEDVPASYIDTQNVFLCRTPERRTVDVNALETGVVDQAAPRGVREDAEQVVVVLDTQRLSRR